MSFFEAAAAWPEPASVGTAERIGIKSCLARQLARIFRDRVRATLDFLFLHRFFAHLAHVAHILHLGVAQETVLGVQSPHIVIFLILLSRY